jgi:putative addiction module killer protein
MKIYTVEIYETPDGKCPYSEWLNNLPDRSARAKIRTRIDRASLGSKGDFESVSSGVYEFKFHFGPGYRVYCGLEEKKKKLILLLCGGSKKGQQKDIEKAHLYWKDAKAEKRTERKEKDAKKKLSR